MIPSIPSTELQSAIGVLQAMLQLRIARTLTEDLLTDKQVPESVNRNIIRQTLEAIDKLQREVNRTIPKSIPYLENRLHRSKIIDIANVQEMMIRIGVEEKPDVYNEFMGLVVDLLDSVYYAQKHRKNIYLPKYKALFKMIADELKTDVNHERGQVQYLITKNTDGSTTSELFLRTAPPVHHPKIK